MLFDLYDGSIEFDNRPAEQRRQCPYHTVVERNACRQCADGLDIVVVADLHVSVADEFLVFLQLVKHKGAVQFRPLRGKRLTQQTVVEHLAFQSAAPCVGHAQRIAIDAIGDEPHPGALHQHHHLHQFVLALNDVARCVEASFQDSTAENGCPQHGKPILAGYDGTHQIDGIDLTLIDHRRLNAVVGAEGGYHFIG